MVVLFLYMRELSKLLVLCVLFVLYFVVSYYIHLYIPCLFHSLTGLLCPGCGITRMILSIFQGNFLVAFCYNKFLFLSFPIFVILFIDYVICIIRNVKPLYQKIPKNICYIYLVCLLVFTVLRNIF